MRRVGHEERGGILIAVIAGMAIAAVLSAVAVQEWRDVIRRDNEAEMMFRAQEYCRALKRYRRDHGGQLPTELKQLMEPGSHTQYFLRHLYKDPLVKDGKWGLLYAAPGGGVVDPNASDVDQKEMLGLGAATPDATDPLHGASERVTHSDTAGGTETTGLPVAGVKSLCTERPFRRYRDQDTYAMWLFSVFDLENQGATGQGNQIGQPGGAPNTRPGGAGPRPAGTRP